MKLAEKQNLRIAEAVFLPKLCRVFQEGEKCGLCADVCPTGAVTLRKSGAPRLKTKLCIGCAACVGVCPVQPQKAFKMREIEKQTSLKG
jgi:Fe-S-cluster-containing dehydrogenase component